MLNNDKEKEVRHEEEKTKKTAHPLTTTELKKIEKGKKALNRLIELQKKRKGRKDEQRSRSFRKSSGSL